jgi:hypothetical protein
MACLKLPCYLFNYVLGKKTIQIFVYLILQCYPKKSTKTPMSVVSSSSVFVDLSRLRVFLADGSPKILQNTFWKRSCGKASAMDL